MIQPTSLLTLSASPLALAPIGIGGAPVFDLSLAGLADTGLPPLQPLAATGKPLPPILSMVAGTVLPVVAFDPAATPMALAAPPPVGGSPEHIQPTGSEIGSPVQLGEPAMAAVPDAVRRADSVPAPRPPAFTMPAARALSREVSSDRPLRKPVPDRVASPVLSDGANTHVPVDAPPAPAAADEVATASLPPARVIDENEMAEPAAPPVVPPADGPSPKLVAEPTRATAAVASPRVQSPETATTGPIEHRRAPSIADGDRPEPDDRPDADVLILDTLPTATPLASPATPQAATDPAQPDPAPTGAPPAPQVPTTVPLTADVPDTLTDRAERPDQLARIATTDTPALEAATSQLAPTHARPLPLPPINEAPEAPAQPNAHEPNTPLEDDTLLADQPAASPPERPAPLPANTTDSPAPTPIPPVTAPLAAPNPMASPAILVPAAEPAPEPYTAERPVEARPVATERPVTITRRPRPTGERQPEVAAMPTAGPEAETIDAPLVTISRPWSSSTASPQPRVAVPVPVAPTAGVRVAEPASGSPTVGARLAGRPSNSPAIGARIAMPASISPAADPASVSTPTRTAPAEQSTLVAPAPPAPASLPTLAPLSRPATAETSIRPDTTVADTPIRRAAAPITPPATSAPPLVAGTTAPAFRLFAAAIHAARTDEADRVAAPAAAPVAAVEPLRALAVGSADGAPLDMTDHRWPHAMVERIERLQDAASATRDASSTSIRLVPDALGTIDVAVRRDGDTVHVHFAAESAQTRTLIADAQPRLQELAEAKGLRLSQSNVGTGAEGQAQRQPAPQPARPVAAPPSALRDDEPELTTTRIG